ncbi:MAG: 1,4-dihydroxy-6-naphthoate synthase [Desulfobacterales bacterium]|nr:1,4-dihydroxy-6-naphthoate synthase [Desulfobacterales bacterium]
MKTPFDLAYSSCPNDTFIFKGIARQLIDTRGMDFKIFIEDVETLNQNAARERYHITKLSFAALGSLLDRYALLRTGAALGKGCGPLLISRPERQVDDRKNPVVAVPGMGTTAYHLFRFYLADLFPGLEPDVRAMPFEQVMPAVTGGDADIGVIIHEGRFIYQTQGLEMKADLGEWWEEKTGLPIPLGCIAVRRDMNPDTACAVQTLIRESIDHAFAHPKQGEDYIKAYAQEMADEVIAQHIGLYVNEFSRDIGDQGTLAVTTFFDHAARAGLIAPQNQPGQPLFAC